MRFFARCGSVVVLVLLAGRSLARAETAADVAAGGQPTRYVQAGLMVGAAKPVVAPNVMAAIEGGMRLYDTGAWLHGAVSYGQSGDDQGPGSNLQLRAGIEGRACVGGGIACGVGGLDVGYQEGRWSERNDPAHNESSEALVTIPRLGLDLGGKNLRARIGIEVDYALVAEREQQPTPMTGGAGVTSSRLVGLEANAGVAYQW